ncbi:hypothetical protein ACFY40_26385 [Streptomyces sp. NPDC012950]|uniref:hypothetical protein n=1 Tax=Streptomyces sp. NPDC012950 TaxID=3364858 RepID=UPI0036D1710F
MWDGLNSRQRSYLLACFREDQEAERRARAARSTYQDPGPASAWRKLPFSIKAELPFAEYTTIQKSLREEGCLDAGAGATLHALARRGLLKITEDRIEVPEVGLVARVLVELTREGRACARAGLGIPPVPRRPKHLLSEWLWGNLARVAAAGPDGLPEDVMGGKAKYYLGTGYHPNGKLSRGYIDCFAIRTEKGRGTFVLEYRWRITEAGRQHINAYRADYQTEYPDVQINAPDPL